MYKGFEEFYPFQSLLSFHLHHAAFRVKEGSGTLLAVQQLRLFTSTTGGTGSTPVGELRSHILHDVAKKSKNKTKTKKTKVQ